MRQKTRTVMRLRMLRRQREMTQGQLATRVGVRIATICEIERGRQTPSLDTAKELSAVFGIPVEQLFEYVEVPA